MKKKSMFFLAIVFVMLFIVGCGSQSNDTNVSGNDSSVDSGTSESDTSKTQDEPQKMMLM